MTRTNTVTVTPVPSSFQDRHSGRRSVEVEPFEVLWDATGLMVGLRFKSDSSCNTRDHFLVSWPHPLTLCICTVLHLKHVCVSVPLSQSPTFILSQSIYLHLTQANSYSLPPRKNVRRRLKIVHFSCEGENKNLLVLKWYRNSCHKHSGWEMCPWLSFIL
jgi:hypothetical protein